MENGIITQMRAEWILPEDKKLDVTLKVLNSEERLTVSIFKRTLLTFKKFIRIFQLHLRNFCG